MFGDNQTSRLGPLSVLKFSKTRNFFPLSSTITFTVPLVVWALLVKLPEEIVVTIGGKVSATLSGVLEQPVKNKTAITIAVEINFFI